MYAVIMIHTFDSDTPTVLFDDYDKAKAYSIKAPQSEYFALC